MPQTCHLRAVVAKESVPASAAVSMRLRARRRICRLNIQLLVGSICRKNIPLLWCTRCSLIKPIMLVVWLQLKRTQEIRQERPQTPQESDAVRFKCIRRPSRSEYSREDIVRNRNTELPRCVGAAAEPCRAAHRRRRPPALHLHRPWRPGLPFPPSGHQVWSPHSYSTRARPTHAFPASRVRPQVVSSIPRALTA